LDPQRRKEAIGIFLPPFWIIGALMPARQPA
jgi:hypothetical protein